MAQTNWSLLGTPAQQIVNHSVGRNADGRLEVFYSDVNSEIWHIWQTAPNGTWSTSALLNKLANASYYSSIAVDENADGRLEVFIIAGGALWHIWQTTAGGNWYNTWFSSGKLSTSAEIYIGPAVAKNKDGRLEVLIAGNDGALWHTWQVTPGKDWNNWDSLGALPSTNVSFSPEVSENSDGRLEVFVASGDGLWHAWQVTPGSWG